MLISQTQTLNNNDCKCETNAAWQLAQIGHRQANN